MGHFCRGGVGGFVGHTVCHPHVSSQIAPLREPVVLALGVQCAPVLRHRARRRMPLVRVAPWRAVLAARAGVKERTVRTGARADADVPLQAERTGQHALARGALVYHRLHGALGTRAGASVPLQVGRVGHHALACGTLVYHRLHGALGTRASLRVRVQRVWTAQRL